MTQVDPAAESYYLKRPSPRIGEGELLEHHFETPVELRTLLQRMWGGSRMESFVVPVTIATFHNRHDDPARTQSELPAFIYTF